MTTDDNPTDGPAYDDPAAGQPSSTTGTEPAPDGQATDAPPWRAMIAVSQLAAHPGNVRADLDLNEEFVNSIAVNGVLVALRITPDGDGFRIIDGGRRLAAALKAGIGEVPYDLVTERAGDEAGQYLDMITTNRHRNPLTVLEEADALFAARKAGAAKTRLRKSTGMSPAAVNDALAAARLDASTRAKTGDLGQQPTLDQYAILAEFHDDPDAVDRLLAVAGWGGSLEHEAERIRQQRADQADHERLCAELDAAGFAVGDYSPAPHQLLTGLTHDGEDLTPETHAACPGRGVIFRPWDLTTPVHYCADPATYGHTVRGATTASAAAPGQPDAPDPAGPPADDTPDPARRIVIQGNKAWAAATEVRRRWLVTLFARRSAPREVAQFIARQLVRMPEPLRSGLGRAHAQVLFSQLTGRDDHAWLEACETAPAGRLPLVMLAPIATAFEYAVSEGEGRHTWRTDRYSPCPRQEAAAYLTLLAGLGYQLSIIEQAVAGQTVYTGETPPGQGAIDDTSEPGNTGGTESEAASAGETDADQDDGTGDSGSGGWPAAGAADQDAA